MAGFAKDVTTPIEIPSVQSPNFSQNTSTAQDVVGLLGFGLQIHQQQEAKRKEEARQLVVNQGIGISQQLKEMRGSMSQRQFLNVGQKVIREAAGGDHALQSKLSSIVAGELSSGLFQQETDENVRIENDQEKEFEGFSKGIGSIAISETFPNQSFGELSIDKKSKVLAKGHRLESELQLMQQKKNEADSEGLNLGSVGKKLEVFGEGLSFLEAHATHHINNLLEKTVLDPSIDKIKAVEMAKQDVVSIVDSQITQLDKEFTLDNYSHLGKDERDAVRSQVNAFKSTLEKKRDFYKNLTTETFDSFNNTATTVKAATGLELYGMSQQFFDLKEALGEGGFSELLKSKLAKDTKFWELMKGTLDKGIQGVLRPRSDQDNAALTLGIIATLGKGSSIRDYGDGEQVEIMRKNWVFTKKMLDGNAVNEENISQVATNMVESLEIAEEVGGIDDKSRALQVLNSTGLKKAYDLLGKSNPELQNALGRKIVQYNVATFGDKANKVLSDNKEIFYDATERKFKLGGVEKKVLSTGAEQVDLTDKLIRNKTKEVSRLNSQLNIISSYAKDDPFLASVKDTEVVDFMLRQSGFNESNVKNGKLTTLTAPQQKAQQRGMSVEDLNASEEATKSFEISADVLDKLEKDLRAGRLDDETKQRARQLLQPLGIGSQTKVAISEASSEEEAAEIARQLWKQTKGQ